MKERAAFYARVSTARQEQEKTIASQLEALVGAASALGLEVPDERRYVDEGLSGARLDRPALDALRDHAADGLLDVVFVYAPDRLARNYVYQQIVLEELERRGVRVHFVERPISERPEDRLLVQMQGVIAEYERAKILERTRRGRLHKVRAGQMLPFGVAPYGYAIVRPPHAPHGVVVVDEVEASHVRTMYRWVLEEGLSARQVAKRLNALGVRPRRARIWVSGSVYTVLTNPAYAGQATYGKREPAEPKKPRKPGAYRRQLKSSHTLRPESQWLAVPIPAIVDAAMQRDVRARLARNVIMATRNTRHEYLLRMLVTCGECGWKMSCERQVSVCKRYEYFYYACTRRDPVDTGRPQPCTARRTRADELDALVWKAMSEWLERPQMLEQELVSWRERRPDGEHAAREQTRLEHAIKHVRAQVERLVDAYQQGAISVDELKARRERLEASQQATEERLIEVRSKQQQQRRSERLVENLAAFAATIHTGLTSLDFAGRQQLVRLLIERVVVQGEDVTIEHVVPLSGRFSGLRLDDRRVLQGPEDGLRLREPTARKPHGAARGAGAVFADRDRPLEPARGGGGGGRGAGVDPVGRGGGAGLGGRGWVRAGRADGGRSAQARGALGRASDAQRAPRLAGAVARVRAAARHGRRLARGHGGPAREKSDQSLGPKRRACPAAQGTLP
jgi:site-specific DNA recombinase